MTDQSRVKKRRRENTTIKVAPDTLAAMRRLREREHVNWSDVCEAAILQEIERRGETASREAAVAELVRAARAADYAFGSLLAVRSGLTDEAMQDLRACLQQAIRMADPQSPHHFDS